jgi:hypothetical protein
LNIDDEERGVVGVHELGAAEESRGGHDCQHNGQARSAERGTRRYIGHSSLVIGYW